MYIYTFRAPGQAHACAGACARMCARMPARSPIFTRLPVYLYDITRETVKRFPSTAVYCRLLPSTVMKSLVKYPSTFFAATLYAGGAT